MNKKTSRRVLKRARVKKSIHKKISGTTEKPRLVVYRSLKAISAQLIDDTTNQTLATVTSLSKAIAGDIQKAKGKTGQAKVIGKLIAEEAKKKNIESVVFDRNGFIYHGRVKAVAESARENGLKF